MPTESANKPTLRAGFASVALKLQEAAGDLSNNDLSRRLGDALKDAYKNSGMYVYLIDVFGDADSGDVVYSCGYNGSCKRCPYMAVPGDDDTAIRYELDTDNADEVYPRTVYEGLPDESEHYAQMQESFLADKLYADEMPLFERFVSKKERDSADAEDFAGKGKSFPILKPQDVSAAAHALGRAGSSNLGPSTIKSRIIAIAKRKGWSSYLPKAWQDGSDSTQGKEGAGRRSNEGELNLVESAATLDTIELREGAAAKSDYEIKLIAPGAGSTAYYPADVLKRDGPKVFKEGTKVFLNHQTDAEEKARPEGDVKDLAGVLTTTAEYHESHAKGPGLYARMKVFADHAQTVAEKAKHVGMSIRAFGSQAIQEGKKVVKDGLPVLGAFKASKSVDIVAEAGAGGMILAESAKPTTTTKQREAMADKMKKCADCEGTGNCAECKGTGKVMKAAEAKTKGKPMPMVDCTDCEGSGDCATCEGDGKVMESARGSATREKEMDETQLKKLIESAVSAAVAPLRAELDKTKNESQPLMERALKGDAIAVANQVLAPIGMREAGKQLVIADCLRNIPVKDGRLDETAFRESVTARAKEVAPALGEMGIVRGMGIAPVPVDPKVAEQRAAHRTQLKESATNVFTGLMKGNVEAAKAAVNKGVAA